MIQIRWKLFRAFWGRLIMLPVIFFLVSGTLGFVFSGKIIVSDLLQMREPTVLIVCNPDEEIETPITEPGIASLSKYKSAILEIDFEGYKESLLVIGLEQEFLQHYFSDDLQSGMSSAMPYFIMSNVAFENLVDDNNQNLSETVDQSAVILETFLINNVKARLCGMVDNQDLEKQLGLKKDLPCVFVSLEQYDRIAEPNQENEEDLQQKYLVLLKNGFFTDKVMTWIDQSGMELMDDEVSELCEEGVKPNEINIIWNILMCIILTCGGFIWSRERKRQWISRYYAAYQYL